METAGGTRIRQDRGGVTFQGEQHVGYRLALWSRVAIRVLEELARAKVSGPDDLYAVAQRVRWSRFVGPDHTIAVFSSVSGHRVRHSQYAALRVKDAVVDQLREERGSRPDVNRDDPDVPLKIVVRDRLATLARDLAGESLHRRGWRPVQVKSPVNEALAAGLLQLTGWDRRSPLADPMCGSGTFLIEAAHLAGDRAPGLRRGFALQRWPDFDGAVWTALLEEAEQRWAVGRTQIPPLHGNDHHAGAIDIARDSAGLAEVAGDVQFEVGDVRAFRPHPAPEMIVVNPPYGVRLADDGLPEVWERLGAWFKDLGAGVAWVLSGDQALTNAMHLKASQRIRVINGGLDCRWSRYELRPRGTGPRRAKPSEPEVG